MTPHADLPLVSFCLTCYNQAAFVRQALEAALAQDYAALEVVVCDDASTDGTWEAVRDLVGRYVAEGGRHRVVLRRNEANLGIAANYEQCFRLARGELLVTGSGDDVSHPDRVSRIVSAWVADGRRATLVVHAAREIDAAGRFGRVLPPPAEGAPCGAQTAYTRRVVTDFPPLRDPRGTYEDVVFEPRARWLGPALALPDCLLDYRVGGTSTSVRRRREVAVRSCRVRLNGVVQTLSDLESCRARLAPEAYAARRRQYLAARRKDLARLALFTGRTFRRRRWGFASLRRQDGVGALRMPPLCWLALLPPTLAVPVWGAFVRAREAWSRFSIRR